MGQETPRTTFGGHNCIFCCRQSRTTHAAFFSLATAVLLYCCREHFFIDVQQSISKLPNKPERRCLPLANPESPPSGEMDAFSYHYHCLEGEKQLTLETGRSFTSLFILQPQVCRVFVFIYFPHLAPQVGLFFLLPRKPITCCEAHVAVPSLRQQRMRVWSHGRYALRSRFVSVKSRKEAIPYARSSVESSRWGSIQG